ncbi:MAG: hypothetical protein ACXWC4_04220 [Telluria sp.]
MIKPIFAVSAVLVALVLAGCGGGGSTTGTAAQQSSQVAVGEPNGSGVDSAAFIKLAQSASSCADRKNRLWLIDGKEVFWDRAATGCPDMNWSQKLYGATPQTVLCSSADSIAGPQTTCANDTVRALFDTITRAADAPNLGLDSSHRVEAIPFAPLAGTVLASNTVAKDWDSGIKQPRTVVIKDADAFTKLWAEHSSIYTEPPRPPLVVDVSRQMLLGVFTGALKVPCQQMGITRVSSTGEKLVVDYEMRMPPADTACAAVIQSPMHLVAVERSDAPVEFVQHQVDLMAQQAIDASRTSQVHTAREVVVEDASAWAALWAEHAGKDVPVPAVDFSKQVVVGIFLGDQRGGCYGLKLDSITRDKSQVTVNYFRTYPGFPVLCTALVVSPATLVAIDRTGLPVVFHKDSLPL